MYNVMLKKRCVNTFADLSMARNALINTPQAHIVYSRQDIKDYEASRSALNGESKDGKTKSKKA